MNDTPFVLEHHLLVIDGHLVKRIGDGRYEAISAELVNDLLSTLDMEPLGPLQVHPAVDQRAPGWSFLQPITTSHISGHYFDTPGEHPHIHIDVYSCRPITLYDVVRVVHKHLNLGEWVGNFILRDMELHGRTSIEFAGKGDQITSESKLRNTA